MTDYPPIDHADIRKGDTIQRVEVYGDMKYLAEGVVHAMGSNGWWRSRRGLGVTYGVASKYTYYLINRPTPVLPTTEGAYIMATRVHGQEGEWLMRLDGAYWFSYDPIGGWQLHAAGHIESWQPVTVTVGASDGE